MNANYDPYILYHNMFKSYPDVKYYNPFEPNYIGMKESLAGTPLDGIKIEKIFSGKSEIKQDSMDSIFKLDINHNYNNTKIEYKINNARRLIEYKSNQSHFY